MEVSPLKDGKPTVSGLTISSKEKPITELATMSLASPTPVAEDLVIVDPSEVLTTTLSRPKSYSSPAQVDSFHSPQHQQQSLPSQAQFTSSRSQSQRIRKTSTWRNYGLYDSELTGRKDLLFNMANTSSKGTRNLVKITTPAHTQHAHDPHYQALLSQRFAFASSSHSMGSDIDASRSSVQTPDHRPDRRISATNIGRGGSNQRRGGAGATASSAAVGLNHSSNSSPSGTISEPGISSISEATTMRSPMKIFSSLLKYKSEEDNNNGEQVEWYNDLFPWMIHPWSNFRFFWDCFVVLLLLYTCVETPFTLAFFDSKELYGNRIERFQPQSNNWHLWWVTINVIIDISLILDVIFNLNTAIYHEKYNILITDRYIVFREYYRSGYLILDVFTSIPLDVLIFNVDGQTIAFLSAFFRLYRLFRIVKLLRFIRTLKLLNHAAFQSHMKTLRVMISPMAWFRAFTSGLVNLCCCVVCCRGPWMCDLLCLKKSKNESNAATMGAVNHEISPRLDHQKAGSNSNSNGSNSSSSSSAHLNVPVNSSGAVNRENRSLSDMVRLTLQMGWNHSDDGTPQEIRPDTPKHPRKPSSVSRAKNSFWDGSSSSSKSKSKSEMSKHQSNVSENTMLAGAEDEFFDETGGLRRKNHNLFGDEDETTVFFRAQLWGSICIHFLGLMFAAHVCACLFYGVSRATHDEKSGGQSTQFDSVNNSTILVETSTWISKAGLIGKPVWKKYSMSLYWAVVTLFTTGYGDIVALNQREEWCSIAVIILGTGLFAYLISVISQLLTTGDTIKYLLRNRLEQAQIYCRLRRFGRSLTRDILAHVEYSCLNAPHTVFGSSNVSGSGGGGLFSGYNSGSMIGGSDALYLSLPYHVRKRVARSLRAERHFIREMFESEVQKRRDVDNLDEVVVDLEVECMLAMRLKLISSAPGETLFEKGEYSKCIYAHKSGTAVKLYAPERSRRAKRKPARLFRNNNNGGGISNTSVKQLSIDGDNEQQQQKQQYQQQKQKQQQQRHHSKHRMSDQSNRDQRGDSRSLFIPSSMPDGSLAKSKGSIATLINTQTRSAGGLRAIAAEDGDSDLEIEATDTLEIRPTASTVLFGRPSSSEMGTDSDNPSLVIMDRVGQTKTSMEEAQRRTSFQLLKGQMLINDRGGASMSLMETGQAVVEEAEIVGCLKHRMNYTLRSQTTCEWMSLEQRDILAVLQLCYPMDWRDKWPLIKDENSRDFEDISGILEIGRLTDALPEPVVGRKVSAGLESFLPGRKLTSEPIPEHPEEGNTTPQPSEQDSRLEQDFD